MPTYEYRCPNGHDFDQFFRKISDAPGELACPACGALAVRRVSGGAGLLFKGSGFYLTDYGKNAHRKAASDAKSGSGDAKSGEKADAGTKSDSGSGGTTSDSGGGAKPSGSASADSKPSSGKSAGGDSK